MEETKAYIEHPSKVIELGNRYSHVMAITLDPTTNHKKGIIRCITSREGDVEIKGYTDRSELHTIEGDSLEYFKIGEKLEIKNEKEILDKLTPEGWDFIGLEDPDIFIDPSTNLTHLYFTIPIKPPSGDFKNKMKIHLGHAVGKSLSLLEMTTPVLLGNEKYYAKEVSITPINSKGFRSNLIESKDRSLGTSYSIVQVAIAKDMGGLWEYGEIVFHPKEHNISWIAGHASPGPLFPKSFIDIGENKLVGVINGREANQKIGDKIKYGMFSVGLFIYDYENGKIDWVSLKPFIIDSEAITITFASQFIETEEGIGILYAHVDDSFVRAYTLNAKAIKKLLP